MSSIPFVMHSDWLDVSAVKIRLKSCSNCKCIYKCLESKAIAEKGSERVSYGGGESRSDEAEVGLNENVMVVP